MYDLTSIHKLCMKLRIFIYNSSVTVTRKEDDYDHNDIDDIQFMGTSSYKMISYTETFNFVAVNANLKCLGYK